MISSLKLPKKERWCKITINSHHLPRVWKSSTGSSSSSSTSSPEPSPSSAAATTYNVGRGDLHALPGHPTPPHVSVASTSLASTSCARPKEHVASTSCARSKERGWRNANIPTAPHVSITQQITVYTCLCVYIYIYTCVCVNVYIYICYPLVAIFSGSFLGCPVALWLGSRQVAMGANLAMRLSSTRAPNRLAPNVLFGERCVHW